VDTMMKQKFCLLALALILAMAFLVAPVAANKYVVTSGSSSPVAGSDVTLSAQLSQDDGTAIPTAGKVVTWTKTGTGGTFSAATSTTDAAGIAAVTFTTGTSSGTAYTFTGTDGDSTTGTSTAVTTVAGAATQIAANAGNGQSAVVNTAVTTPPSVLVKDANNNPVNGVSVTFAVATGGGSVSGGSATTGANGIASVGSWTVGPTAGSNTLTATSGTLTGSPVTFTATGTSGISVPTITTVDPATGINNGLLQGVVVTGTGFTTGTTQVRLVKSGQANISMANSVITTTTVTGAFQLNGALPGTWDVVVITDGGTATKSAAFTVVNSSAVSTVTAISPTSATTNTTVTSTITGTGFGTSARMRLARSGYNDIIGSVSTVAATSVVGTFDLTNQVPGTWNVCVLYDGTNRVCGPTFTINSASVTNGSVYFTSTPSGATVWLDSNKSGLTPLTLANITPGSHTVKFQKTNYLDWSGSITVTSGNQTAAYGKLIYQDTTTTAPTPTPVIVTTATLPPTSAKSTKAVPTSWPSATATPSPIDALVVIGAIGLGIVLVRKQ
jgi:hypothetical protein